MRRTQDIHTRHDRLPQRLLVVAMAGYGALTALGFWAYSVVTG